MLTCAKAKGCGDCGSTSFNDGEVSKIADNTYSSYEGKKAEEVVAAAVAVYAYTYKYLVNTGVGLIPS